MHEFPAIPSYYLFTHKEDDAQEALENFRTVALELRGKAFFMHADLTIKENTKLSDYYGFYTYEELPLFRIGKIGSNFAN